MQSYSMYNLPAAVVSTGTGLVCDKLTSIRQIEVQFAKMTHKIKQALINNNVDVVSLIEQLCTISAVKSNNVPLFDDDVFEKIKSIDEFWRKARNFWGIFDYELLQFVVEISECREAQVIFNEFLSKIDPSKIQDVDLVLHCKKQYPEGSLKPVLRVKVNAEVCTIDVKKHVEKRVAETFNLKNYALRFQGIKEGCIELLYYISKPLKLYLLQFKISEGVVERFLASKIVSLHIEEFKLRISSRISDITVSYR